MASAKATTPPLLLLDTREAGLAAECSRLGIPYTVVALDVGDMLIQAADGTPLLVAERKSLADFAASNADGRYREQRARLMAVRGSGVAVLYILEGTWSGHDERLPGGGGRTTEGQLRRLTTRLILRYGMPVLASANIAETARWCATMLAQLGDDAAVFVPESGSAAESTAAAMAATYTATFSAVKKCNRSADGIATGMLSAIPGLGSKKVTALLATHSVADIAALTVADIAALTIGGKRIGDKLAATIHEALHWHG